MNKITVYSNHCPACNILVGLLDKKEIPYIVIDNEQEVLAAAEAANINDIPFCSIPGEEKIRSYRDMINYINSL